MIISPLTESYKMFLLVSLVIGSCEGQHTFAFILSESVLAWNLVSHVNDSVYL